MHGFLSRDGIEPAAFRERCRADLRTYPNVEWRDIAVRDAERVADGFELELADGTRGRSRKLLLATGLVDTLLAVAGMQEFYGRGVYHCPYCDGWEVRNQPLAVYGAGADAHKMALELTVWSNNIVLCTDGPSGLGTAQEHQLLRNGIRLRPERIRQLTGRDGELAGIVFDSGAELPRRALFFVTATVQRSALPAKFGCVPTHEGDLPTGSQAETHVPGLFVAGDASTEMRLVIGAAAKGAEAAFRINAELLVASLR